jgi:hypothetical protein
LLKVFGIIYLPHFVRRSWFIYWNKTQNFGDRIVRSHKELRANLCINVTLKYVPATNVPFPLQQLLHNLSVCICSLTYLTCKAHAPYYCYLWLVSLYHILPSYLTNAWLSEKLYRVWNVFFIFSTNFVRNIVKISTMIFVSNTGLWTQLKN